MSEEDEEYQMEDSSSEMQMRPDIVFTLNRKKFREMEDYDLEEEEDGFHCHSCGWRSVSYPMTNQDNILSNVCPECGEDGVENKLTTQVNEIKEIYENADKDETDFVPYKHFKKNFEPPQARLDEALNHLITNRSLHVVFHEGESLIHISGR